MMQMPPLGMPDMSFLVGTPGGNGVGLTEPFLPPAASLMCLGACSTKT